MPPDTEDSRVHISRYSQQGRWPCVLLSPISVLRIRHNVLSKKVTQVHRRRTEARTV